MGGIFLRRRRAAVLVLVMTVLGVLFVAGLAFMATMNFDAELISLQKARAQRGPAVNAVVDDLGSLIADLLVPAPGDEPTGTIVGGTATSFAEIPGVHSLVASSAPFYSNPTGVSGKYVLRNFTNLTSLSKTPFEGKPSRDMIDVRWRSGIDAGSQPGGIGDVFFGNELRTIDANGDGTIDNGDSAVPVDADGDGIVDSVQVELVEEPPADLDTGFFVVDSAQIDNLREVVNPPSNPDGKVFLGLRVVSHGAMVNLNYSHNQLIRNALGLPIDPDNYPLPQDEPDFDGYEAATEESILRRRNFIPSRVIPPSELHGNQMDTSDALGGGDFSRQLFPQATDPEEDLWNHRYWPFAPDETSVDSLVPDWVLRMDPSQAMYDRRHLVTTVSHDDLLRRDTVVEWVETDIATGINTIIRKDVLELMKDANAPYANVTGCAGLLPFEYIAYPHGDAANNTHMDTYSRETDPTEQSQLGDWCKCAGDADQACEHNPLKGKLRVSLPWLQDAVLGGVINDDQRIRIIQDAFTLMLYNAVGPEWVTYQSVLDSTGNPVTVRKYEFDAISRTAASLTANMIDFMDSNDAPTKVELRSADFTPAGLATFGQPTGQSVYGLERQPYITEIVVRANDWHDADDLLGGDGILQLDEPFFFGVELANPDTDREINLNQFSLFVGSAEYKLTGMLGPDNVVGVWNADTPTPVLLNNKSGAANLVELPGLMFDETDTISLVHTATGTNIVVDQFNLDDNGNDYQGNGVRVGAWDNAYRSCERVAKSVKQRRWMAPIPIDFTDPDAYPTGNKSSLGLKFLGRTASAELLQPVEALIANSGSFETAFPTTGSLLLLMRHANTAKPVFGTGTPFTTYLRDRKDLELDVPYEVYKYDATVVFGNSIITEPRFPELQIDNGRMPVFDVDNLHRLDPAIADPLASGYLDPSTVPPNPALTYDDPGDVAHLPWGMLVFDYFTALPLDSKGPFEFGGDPNIPKVDEEGLRVHGRININAATWDVMQGLPTIPINDIPGPFQDTFRSTLFELGCVPNSSPDAAEDSKAGMLGTNLANAIAAYRDARAERLVGTWTTGEYGDDYFDSNGILVPGWRGWGKATPKARRGTGFMSVGELANVRHTSATGNALRVDDGEVEKTDAVGQPIAGSYLKAIALLASLGDWVTVRSQVFTTYGVLRGEMDEAIEDTNPDIQAKLRAADVDSRAIRFQETLDRLPTVVGKSEPARVGKRTVAKYNDFVND